MAASGARRFGGRLAIGAVLSGLLVPVGIGLTLGSAAAATSVAPAAVPAAGPVAAAVSKAKPKGSSWKLARTINFTGSALPTGCSAYTSKYTAGANAWTSKEVTVSGGLLKIALEKKKTSGKPYTSGGLACLDWGQKYGRYEVRAKVPAGKGIDSTIALWPVNSRLGAWTGLELLAPGPDTAYLTNGYSTKFDRASVPGDYAGKFHDYVIEWSPQQVRMTVDGKQIYYSTHAFKDSRWFAIVVSNGDALTGVPDSSTKLPAKLQVDSVKVWTYTGVPPKAQVIPTATPTPTGSGAAAPSSSASGSSSDDSTSAPKLPATSPTEASALQSQNTSADTSPVLAGGLWPWLLGGSLIAAAAIASLNYPNWRRSRQAPR
jgi:beta-glucanase (GH16 family)